MSDPDSPPPNVRWLRPLGENLGSGPPTALQSFVELSGFDASQISWEPFLVGGGYQNPRFSLTPDPEPIPPLISAHGIDEGDVNVLLSSVSKLPFPTAFKTLLASTMALWVASAPDVTTIKSHGLDTVIDGFMEFIAPPTLPTAVSPV